MCKLLVSLLILCLATCAFADATIRVVHAVANGPDIDVFVDGDRILRNVEYTDITDYEDVDSGNTDIEIQVDGDELVSGTFNLRDNRIYTITVAGLLSDTINFPISLLITTDSDSTPASGDTTLRFLHTSAGSPNVDVYADDNLVWQNIAYGTVGSYQTVRDGSYSIDVRVAGTNTIVVGPVDLDFDSRSINSIFAVGIPNDNDSPLTAIVAQDFDDSGNDSSASGIVVSGSLVLFAVFMVL
jgi:hypothetical protein